MDIKGILMDNKKNGGVLKYLKNSKWDAYSNPNEPRKQQIFLPKLE